MRLWWWRKYLFWLLVFFSDTLSPCGVGVYIDLFVLGVDGSYFLHIPCRIAGGLLDDIFITTAVLGLWNAWTVKPFFPVA